MENRCVACGEIVPEGRQICKACEEKAKRAEENKEEKKER